MESPNVSYAAPFNAISTSSDAKWPTYKYNLKHALICDWRSIDNCGKWVRYSFDLVHLYGFKF